MAFEHSESQIAHPRIMVSYLSFEFDKYQIERENGILYLSGENSDFKHLSKKKKAENYNILLELMILHNNLDITKSMSPVDFYTNICKIISDKDLEQILKFTKKYGLPYYKCENVSDSNVYFNLLPHDDSEKDSAESNIYYSHGVFPFANLGKIDITAFINAIHHLNEDFLKVIAYNELETDFKDYLTDKQKKRVSHLSNWFKKHKQLNLMSHYNQPFITRWNNETLSLEVETENIMHLAAYHLCLMASAGIIGGYIRQCKGCGMLFVTENPRLQYCQNPCTRQNVHMRKIRKNTKSLE